MADRTKAEFELWVENGVKLLSKIEIREKTEIIIHEDLSDEIISPAKRKEITSEVTNNITNLYYRRIQNIITNNLELIYAVVPDIAPENAIKVAFTTGLINNRFSEIDLQLAVMACLKTRR